MSNNLLETPGKPAWNHADLTGDQRPTFAPDPAAVLGGGRGIERLVEDDQVNLYSLDVTDPAP